MRHSIFKETAMPRLLHLDMDQVVVDFRSHYLAVTGYPWDDQLTPADRWAPLAGKEEGFFLAMPAFPGSVDFVQAVERLAAPRDIEVRFLTAIPSLMPFPTAEAEKTQWVREQLNSALPVAIGPYARDKVRHCRPGDILIDDNPQNIAQWRAAGGHGILHTDFESSLLALYLLLAEEEDA